MEDHEDEKKDRLKVQFDFGQLFEQKSTIDQKSNLGQTQNFLCSLQM